MNEDDLEQLKELLWGENRRSHGEGIERLKILAMELKEDNPGEDAIRLAEWRGRTTMAIEWLVKGQKELKDAVGKLDRRVVETQVKSAGVAATVAILVSIVVLLLSR